MKLLALDFDGVISDSAPEAFLVALRTWIDLRPGSALARIRDRVEAGGAGTIALEPAYRRFVDLMPLGNRAEDYGVTFAAIESRAAIPDQAAYDRFYASLEPSFRGRFHERFYESRAALRRDEPERWRSLLGPYPGFVDLLRRRARDVGLAIATAKDRESVDWLLRDYGIADLFPPGLVLDKEAGVRKDAHLQLLRERHGVDFAQVTFVDDKLNHLDHVAPLGVRCVLAGWGYNGERERQAARARGHLVCDITNFEALVFEGPNVSPDRPLGAAGPEGCPDR